MNGDGEETEPERDGDHLDDVPEGAGCTEIWEHLSEERDVRDG